MMQPSGDAVAEPQSIPPSIADVPYGDHPRQKIDFWQANSSSATPLVFFLHGGGWIRGDKAECGRKVKQFLDQGISVVAVNYRFTWQAQVAGVHPPIEWPMHDVKRALQFVRTMANAWAIDPNRIGAWGGSAGACSGLWLALHPDMAEPSSADPVARQSTRLQCAAFNGAQTTLDPRQMIEWTPNSTYGGHAFGFCDPSAPDLRDAQFGEFLCRCDEVLPWIKQYSPIEFASAAAPPLCLAYDAPPKIGHAAIDPTHTANFGLKLKDKLATFGVACDFIYPERDNATSVTTADWIASQLLKPSIRV